MLHCLLKSVVILLVTCIALPLSAQQRNRYNTFDNRVLQGLPEQVNCFAMDDGGRLWFGTQRGLCSYDAHAIRRGDAFAGQVYCIAIVENVIFCGTDEGLRIVDIAGGKLIENQSLAIPQTIRALETTDSTLWIGAANGLFKCNINNREVLRADTLNVTLPNPTVYALQALPDNRLLVGTYDGLCAVDIHRMTSTTIELPKHRNNNFVNSLLFDEAELCTWIGTEGALLKYDNASGNVAESRVAYGNSIKSLAKDEPGELLIGTDNGLFVLDQDNQVRHIIHDARNSNSLIDNIVWSIMADDRGDIWIGTDAGISLFNTNDHFITIADISRSNNGNALSTILVDSKGRLWLGGSNGLILTDREFSNVSWYRLGNEQYPLPHNRIRHVYEDTDGTVWIATDGGVNRYDERTHQFVRHDIISADGRYNANWAYEIYDDGRGNMWVATCQGGVLSVDKNELLKSVASPCIAQQTLTTTVGLPNDYIEHIRADNTGSIYMALHKSGIYKYEPRSKNITLLEQCDDATVLHCALNGQVLIGCTGRLVTFAPGGQRTEIALNQDDEVYAMTEEHGRIWISTSGGLYVADIADPTKCRRVSAGGRRYTALRYDALAQQIYFGGVDVLSIETPKELLATTVDKRATQITALYIDEQLYLQSSDARYLQNVELTSEQNNLSFDVSDFDYTDHDGRQYAYKLDGWDTDWHLMHAGEHKVQYLGLKYGEYNFMAGKQLADGRARVDSSLAIVIGAPWYLTNYAFAGYFVLIIVLFIWVIYFFDVKQKLHIEHLERMRTQEQTQLKIDFFTNVSHDFKTPMSLVIGPLGNIISRTEDGDLKLELEAIMRSARQLNSMINKALKFSRVDNELDDQLTLSTVDIVEFSRSILNTHKETPAAAKLELRFETTHSKIFVRIDVLQMESVLNNLISNACKYTSKGSVTLSVVADEASKIVLLRVRDTGIGIPRNELELVFQKFYRSSRTPDATEGSGIGLHLVKQYVERMGGTVAVDSVVDKGSTFTVQLHIVDEMKTSDNQPDVTSSNTDKPLILIVEDNTQIADFIVSTLSDYRTIVAHNGQQGLELCLDNQPDIVVADVMMPVMDGMEMSKRIRQDTRTATTPIVMLTAKDDDQTMAESMRNNVDAFIPKPFEPQQLQLRIEQILHSRAELARQAQLSRYTEPSRPSIKSADEMFMEKLISTVEANIHDNEFNVNQLAEKLNMNPKQLYRKVKALTGQTSVEYINSIRIKRAAQLLSQGPFTIAEVMYMVGFNNPSYFAKCFAALYGMTPKQYATANRKDQEDK